MKRPPVRVGGIDYLNALPLTRFMEKEGDPRCVVTEHSPSALADRLRQGTLDVALAPVVEYLYRPDYRAVPGCCISSYGPVESIRFYMRRPLDELRAIALDVSSRSSTLLLRLLSRELWNCRPRLLPMDPGQARSIVVGEKNGGPDDTEIDGVLLIGDAALCTPAPESWSLLDLGTEWTRWTGLPFVYAIWIWRNGSAPPGLISKLIDAKRYGLARLDDIVRAVKLPAQCSFGDADCLDYLRRAIQYDLGPRQTEAVHLFFSLLERNGLVACAPRPLRFVDEA